MFHGLVGWTAHRLSPALLVEQALHVVSVPAELLNLSTYHTTILPFPFVLSNLFCTISMSSIYFSMDPVLDNLFQLVSSVIDHLETFQLVSAHGHVWAYHSTILPFASVLLHQYFTKSMSCLQSTVPFCGGLVPIVSSNCLRVQNSPMH